MPEPARRFHTHPAPPRAIADLPVQQALVEPAILHVRVPDFAAVAQARAQSVPADRALIVGSDAAGRGVVLAASPVARAAGARAGMPLRAAEKLCPHALVLPVDAESLEAAARAVLVVLGRYTPEVEPGWLVPAKGRRAHPSGSARVSRGHGDMPDARAPRGGLAADWPCLARRLGVTLDVRGCERLFGSPTVIAERITSDLAAQGYTAHLGVAANPRLAEVASALAAVEGAAAPVTVAVGQERAFLDDLPLTLFEHLDDELLECLRVVGIRRAGQLALLSAAALRRRHGSAGEQAHAEARGEATRPVIAPPAPPTLEAACTLDDAVTDLPRLEHELGRLAERLARQLAARGQSASLITLRLEMIAPSLRSPMRSGGDGRSPRVDIRDRADEGPGGVNGVADAEAEGTGTEATEAGAVAGGIRGGLKATLAEQMSLPGLKAGVSSSAIAPGLDAGVSSSGTPSRMPLVRMPHSNPVSTGVPMPCDFNRRPSTPTAQHEANPALAAGSCPDPFRHGSIEGDSSGARASRSPHRVTRAGTGTMPALPGGHGHAIAASCEPCLRAERRLHLKQPVAGAPAILERTRELLVQLAPDAPVVGMILELAALGPAATQLSFPIVTGDGSRTPPALEVVAGKLRARFGPRAARGVRLAADALLPEERVIWDGPDATPSPWPRVLAVRAGADGRPLAVRRDNAPWEVVDAICAHWRLRTRWWADLTHRYYYLVETSRGALLEIYQEQCDGRWWLTRIRD